MLSYQEMREDFQKMVLRVYLKKKVPFYKFSRVIGHDRREARICSLFYDDSGLNDEEYFDSLLSIWDD